MQLGGGSAETLALEGLSHFLRRHEESDLALRLLRTIGREKIILQLVLLQEDVAAKVQESLKKRQNQSRQTPVQNHSHLSTDETPRAVRNERNFQDREVRGELDGLKAEQKEDVDELTRRWEDAVSSERQGRVPSAWFERFRQIYSQARPLIGIPTDKIPPNLPPPAAPPSTGGATTPLSKKKHHPPVPKLDLSAVVKPDPPVAKVLLGGGTAAATPGSTTPHGDDMLFKLELMDALRRRELLLNELSDALLRELAREGLAWKTYKEGGLLSAQSPSGANRPGTPIVPTQAHAQHAPALQSGGAALLGTVEAAVRRIADASECARQLQVGESSFAAAFQRHRAEVAAGAEASTPAALEAQEQRLLASLATAALETARQCERLCSLSDEIRGLVVPLLSPEHRSPSKEEKRPCAGCERLAQRVAQLQTGNGHAPAAAGHATDETKLAAEIRQARRERDEALRQLQHARAEKKALEGELAVLRPRG
eukprot:tig00020538_g10381.t1